MITSMRRAVIAPLLVLALVPLHLADPAVADHTGGSPGPVHAGNTWGWYQHGVERHEFVGALPGHWERRAGTGNVQIQNGMLTLNTGKRRSTAATLTLPGRTTGRWEIRMRARRYEKKHVDYKVVTELVPAARPERCGAQNIGLESFTLGSSTVKHYSHTLPNNTFRAFKGRNLKADRWHTYAVEVAGDHISWFVDAHVISTERRPEALSGVPLTLRFEMRGTPGKRMNRSRMQMDWMRYWTMQAPNEKPVAAPPTQKSVFHDAC